MSQVTISSHDFLGKLSVVKNYLSVVIADEKNMDSKHVEYLKNAFDANQSLIDAIKKTALLVKP